MIRVDHTNRKAVIFMGTSNRWSCPACRVIKFANKIEHLVSLPKLVVVHGTHIGELIERAKEADQGYFVIYFQDRDERLFVSTPEVLAEYEPVDTLDVLRTCLAWIKDSQVSRMVIGDAWKPVEEKPAIQTVRYSGCATAEEAGEVLEEAGLSRRYGSYSFGDVPASEVVERLDEALFQRGGIDPIL